MMKASLAWLPCAHKQEDGSSRYAVIELNDSRMGTPVILQMPEHLYSMAGGNDLMPEVLAEVVARINKKDIVVPIRPSAVETHGF
jgi:hypothetical protein